jgi:hypothetical protein
MVTPSSSGVSQAYDICAVRLSTFASAIFVPSRRTTHCSRQSRSQCPLALVSNLTDNGAGFVEDVSL